MSTTTMNMGLTKPGLTDSADITVLDTDMDIVDTHDHSNGKGVQIPTAGIADGAVTSAKIAAAAVGTSQIASGAVTTALIASGAIGTAQISATAGITGSQLANQAVTATQIANGTITTAQISLSAGISGSQLQNQTITATQIANGTITTTQISGTAGITGSQLANQTVTATQLANGAVGSSQLANGAVGASQMSSGALASQIAGANATLTLSNAYQDVGGATLSLPAGTYLVFATFHVTCHGAGDVGQNFTGQINVNGVNQGAKAEWSFPADNYDNVVHQIARITLGNTQTVKLQALKSGGSGTSSVEQTHTSIAAISTF